MDAARASGTVMASSLRQNTFLIEKNRIFEDHQSCEDFQHFGRSSKIIENRACPNLDAMSVPEALESWWRQLSF